MVARADFGYLTKTKDGRILKSSTMYIRDDTGRIAYLLGINQDITEFVMMHRLLDSLVNTGQEDAGSVEKNYDECIGTIR